MNKMQESKRGSVERMDFTQCPNWRSTKILLWVIGAWPFQSLANRILYTSVTLIMVGSIFIPEILKVITVRKSLAGVVACLPHVSYHSLSFIIIFSFSANSQMVKTLFLRIRKDWESDMIESEKKILIHDQYDNATVLSVYQGFIGFVSGMYLIMPLIPIIFDEIKPLNVTRPRLTMYHTEYFIDKKKYDVPVILHEFFVTPFPPIVILAFDTMFAASILHASSIFTIVGSRTQFLINNIESQGPSNTTLIVQNETHKALAECIRMHEDVLEFVDLLTSAFSTCLFLMNLISMMNLSMTGYQAITNVGNTGRIAVLMFYVVAQLLRLYFRCWFGQKLINSSEFLFDSVYQSNWYDLPSRSRHFIILMLERGRKESKITAGKIVEMSVENFTFVVKTAMSYFTVLRSVQ